MTPMTPEIIVLGSLILILAGMIMGASALSGWNWKKFKQMLHEPAYLPVQVSHTTEMKLIVEIIPYLNISEKELILHKVFDRPIRILKAGDRDGQWFEGVSSMSLEDHDLGMHFEQRGGIKSWTG